jgi:DNA segregation ATPase FtsK/SpoIIIE-like protein
MTKQDEQIKQLQQIVSSQSQRLQRIESLFKLSTNQDASEDTVIAMQMLQEYYQTLPDTLQEKLNVDLPTALEILDELEDNGFINRNPIEEITDPEFVDDLFEQVCSVLVTQEFCSPSYLQRHFDIGYNRAARIVDQLEKKQFVSPTKGTQKRKVYAIKISEWLSR